MRTRARPPRRGDPAGGTLDHRGDRAGVDPGHRGHHGAAAGLHGRRAGSLRPLRHRVHRRRGDGGLRPDRKVVRHRPFRRHAGSDHLRQGCQLRLRPARRRGDQPGDRRRRSPTAPIPAGSPTRVIRWPPPRPSPPSMRWKTRASSPTPPASVMRSSDPAWPTSPRAIASVGEVRGLGVFWAVELVADRQTREPLAPYGGSQPGDERGRRGLQERRHASLCELQPDPRRPAVHGQRRRKPARVWPSSTPHSMSPRTAHVSSPPPHVTVNTACRCTDTVARYETAVLADRRSCPATLVDVPPKTVGHREIG